jgi:hypothetical protein
MAMMPRFRTRIDDSRCVSRATELSHDLSEREFGRGLSKTATKRLGQVGIDSAPSSASTVLSERQRAPR